MPDQDGPTYDTFVDFLERVVPESRPLIAELGADILRHGDEFESSRGPYAVTTEVFVQRLLFPALETGDVDRLGRCFAVIEQMLGSDDDRLQDLAKIRLGETLTTTGHASRYGPLAEAHLGPRLREQMGRMRGG